MLKLLPKIDDITFIVPVATVAVGWVTVKLGDPGVAGWEFTVTNLAAEMQPAAFFAIIL